MSLQTYKLLQTTRDDLKKTRRHDLPAKVRDCLEPVQLADPGWTDARIAEHLGCCYARRRTSSTSSAAAMPSSAAAGRPPTSPAASTSPGCSVTCSPRIYAQLAEALRGIRPRYLQTVSTVENKHESAKAARAEAVLGGIITGTEAGLLNVVYLDECGFARLAADRLRLVPAGVTHTGSCAGNRRRSTAGRPTAGPTSRSDAARPINQLVAVRSTCAEISHRPLCSSSGFAAGPSAKGLSRTRTVSQNLATRPRATPLGSDLPVAFPCPCRLI
jgi:hypothetical protein